VQLLTFLDKVRSEHDLHHWIGSCQVFYLDIIQEHLRCTKVSHCGILRACVCHMLDRQLRVLALVHLLPNHSVHRAVLWQQLRRDCTNVFGPTGMLRPHTLSRDFRHG
jgi:hypothetical protein